jgi:O-antigen/teichoic acid export membrane protein
MTQFRPAINRMLTAARTAGSRYRQVNTVLADQIVVSGSNFLTGVVVARALGIEAFGVFSLAWMLVLFLQSLQAAIVLSPMMSIAPKQTVHESAGYFAVVVLHQLLVGVVFAVLAAGLCLLAPLVGMPHEIGDLAAPLAISVFAMQAHEFLRRYNFTVGSPARVLVSDVIRYGTMFGVFEVLLVSHKSDVTIGNVLYVIAGSAFLASISLWATLPSASGAGRRFREITHRHFQVSRWLLGSAPLMWITSNFSMIAAGAVLGPAAVGALKAAQSLMSVTNLFFQAAESFAPPRAARIFHTEGKSGLGRFVVRVTTIGLIVTGGACLVLGLPGGFWMQLVFGKGYGAYPLAVLGYGVLYLILSCMIPIRFAFQAAERTRPDFMGYIAATVFTLALSYPLVHLLGVYGAVVASVLAQAIMFSNLFMEYRRFMRDRVMPEGPAAEGNS